MTDTLPPIALSPEQAQAMPEPTRNAARTAYAQHYDAAEIERVFGAATTPQQAPAAPAPSAANTAAGHIPARERISAFQKLRAAGVDDATLQKAAAEEGIAWSDVAKDASAAPAEPVTLQDANERLAQSSGFDAPSLSPHDFHFQFQPAHVSGLEPDEVRAINDAFADGFHQAGVPLNVAPALFREAMSSADKFAELDDAARTLAFRSEGARLQRLGNVEQIKNDAEHAWARLPKAFQDFAAEHFLFHSAESYAALANAGAMMKAMEGRKK